MLPCCCRRRRGFDGEGEQEWDEQHEGGGPGDDARPHGVDDDFSHSTGQGEARIDRGGQQCDEQGRVGWVFGDDSGLLRHGEHAAEEAVAGKDDQHDAEVDAQVEGGLAEGQADDADENRELRGVGVGEFAGGEVTDDGADAERCQADDEHGSGGTGSEPGVHVDLHIAAHDEDCGGDDAENPQVFEGLEPIAEGDGWQGDRGNPPEDRDEGCGAEYGECPHGVAPVGLPDDEAEGNAEGGCGHEPAHDDGEGAAAFVGGGEGDGDGGGGGGEQAGAEGGEYAGGQGEAEGGGECGGGIADDESDESEFEGGVAPEATGDGTQYGGGQGKGDTEGGDELPSVGGGNVEFLGDCREEAGDHECVGADGEGHDGEREEDPQRHIV